MKLKLINGLGRQSVSGELKARDVRRKTWLITGTNDEFWSHVDTDRHLQNILKRKMEEKLREVTMRGTND